MTEASTTTATIATATVVPVPIADNLFSITHQFFDQYRTDIFVLTGSLMAAWFYNKVWVNRKFYSSLQPMLGKTVLITGGDSGIGFETVKDLLRRGARVIIACRNMDKGGKALVLLRNMTECEEKNIRLMECDLCSLKSIHEFAKLYNEQEERLDVLICNAGIVWAPHVVTKDGFNSVIQANYLGHFLLTNLLLDKLKKCRPSRIVNVSSGTHKLVRSIDWSDALTQFKASRLFGAYTVSKLFLMLSSRKLKQDLVAEGVNVFCLNPGWVWTSIQNPMLEAIGFIPFLIFYPILRLLKIALAKTPKTGARTTVFCAVEPSLENSPYLYFESCAPSQTSSLCNDDALVNQLWKVSCEAVAL